MVNKNIKISQVQTRLERARRTKEDIKQYLAAKGINYAGCGIGVESDEIYVTVHFNDEIPSDFPCDWGETMVVCDIIGEVKAQSENVSRNI